MPRACLVFAVVGACAGSDAVAQGPKEQVLASLDAGDVSWVLPSAQFSAATWVPGFAYRPCWETARRR